MTLGTIIATILIPLCQTQGAQSPPPEILEAQTACVAKHVSCIRENFDRALKLGVSWTFETSMVRCVEDKGTPTVGEP